MTTTPPTPAEPSCKCGHHAALHPRRMVARKLGQRTRCGKFRCNCVAYEGRPSPTPDPRVWRSGTPNPGPVTPAAGGVELLTLGDLCARHLGKRLRVEGWSQTLGPLRTIEHTADGDTSIAGEGFDTYYESSRAVEVFDA